MTSLPRPTEREIALRRSKDALTSGASRWIRDALTAWMDDEHAKVAALAPLAVEHLGKAVLWHVSPSLLLPLAAEAEASLFILVQKPDLAAAKLRTIGLRTVLSRLETLLGGLPIDGKQRTRMVDSRNGAIHVGSAEQSQYVLIDALTLCAPLLEHLGQSASDFYGEHMANAHGLMQRSRTEVEHRVAAKMARSRRVLTHLEEELETSEFEDVTSTREASAEYDLDPRDHGGAYAIKRNCPECGMVGHLFGEVDVSPDYDYDDVAVGSYHVAGYALTFYPEAFACNVCRLALMGQQELAAARLPSSRVDVEEYDFVGEFDSKAVAEEMYGGE